MQIHPAQSSLFGLYRNIEKEKWPEKSEKLKEGTEASILCHLLSYILCKKTPEHSLAALHLWLPHGNHVFSLIKYCQLRFTKQQALVTLIKWKSHMGSHALPFPFYAEICSFITWRYEFCDFSVGRLWNGRPKNQNELNAAIANESIYRRTTSHPNPYAHLCALPNVIWKLSGSTASPLNSFSNEMENFLHVCTCAGTEIISYRAEYPLL